MTRLAAKFLVAAFLTLTTLRGRPARMRGKMGNARSPSKVIRRLRRRAPRAAAQRRRRS